MNIRRAKPEDRQTLLDIWLRSVRATHGFLSEADIQFYLPLVRDVALVQLELWVLTDEAQTIRGFMGLSGPKVEALFIAPEFLRSGGGRALIDHAQRLHDELTVDVNEQNEPALRFYRSMGFVPEGRSPLDGTGRPFPLIHLRRKQIP